MRFAIKKIKARKVDRKKWRNYLNICDIRPS